jgi:hypothetical protein
VAIVYSLTVRRPALLSLIPDLLHFHLSRPTSQQQIQYRGLTFLFLAPLLHQAPPQAKFAELPFSKFEYIELRLVVLVLPKRLSTDRSEVQVLPPHEAISSAWAETK